MNFVAHWEYKHQLRAQTTLFNEAKCQLFDNIVATEKQVEIDPIEATRRTACPQMLAKCAD